MDRKDFTYIYGPVSSWRLGSSLGIDPVFQGKKVCSFDCMYCQLGATRILTAERKIFVPVARIIEELEALPKLEVDYISFSGTGEPTLAKNLGGMIGAVKKLRPDKVAVITNASLMGREDVQQDLLEADVVIAKLDAASPEVFEKVNRPCASILFESTVQGIKDFRRVFKGKLFLQIMFVQENQADALSISRIAREINPDAVQLNTPLRPCLAKPISPEQMRRIKSYFEGMRLISVYEATLKKVTPISGVDTLARRGKAP